MGLLRLPHLSLLLILLVAAPTPLVMGRPEDGVVDWSLVAEDAEARQLPIAILFTAPDCGHCERLLEEVIWPGFSGGELRGRALVGVVSIAAGGKLLDFDGELIRLPLFVKRYQVFATPTLVLVAPNGEPLAPAVVGYASDTSTYQADLAQALTQATALLRAPDRKEAFARHSR